MYCQSGTTSSLTRAMLLSALFICAEPGATCKLCLETGKSFRRSELNILVSLSFVFFFFWKQQLLLSAMERLPLGFPMKIALSARGTMGRRFLSFPSHRSPRAFFSPSPQSPYVKKGLCGGEKWLLIAIFCRKKMKIYVCSRLSLNGHLYQRDTSVKRTPRVCPCLS